MADSTVTSPSSSNTTTKDCSAPLCQCVYYMSGEAMMYITLVLYLLIFVVGLVENILVLWINWQMKKAKKESNLYIFNLAISDMIAVLIIPLRIIEILLHYRWIWGSFLCKLDGFLYCLNLYCNVFFLLSSSVDRYFSLRYPAQAQGSRDRRIRRLICVSVWTLAMVLSIPNYLFHQLYGYYDNYCFLDSRRSWYIQSSLTLIFGFVIPFPIIIVSNIITAKAAKASGNKEIIRTCKLIYGYIITFLICWSPYYFLLLAELMDWDQNCYMLYALYFFYDFTVCLTCTHCIINPILFNFMYKDFRYHFATSIVKFLPKKYAKEDDDVSISSDTRHIVVIS
ncbi:G-protein coupled receptor 182 [Amblyraja radiata]|uniref:G-protein coupled receptor 182 n=1 Tax=Amblyraja radiata TaxID=386614 RepID=UPI001401D7FB|nr:G-protein coupled receptor 182 [Amblyraja radiata]